MFDTYAEGSIKDSERVRRTAQRAIDILNISEDTVLSVKMNTFWSSLSNKTKLQLFVRTLIIVKGTGIFPDTRLILSWIGVGNTEKILCESVVPKNKTELVAHMDFLIEEADVRQHM